jgi:hypothetical protein
VRLPSARAATGKSVLQSQRTLSHRLLDLAMSRAVNSLTMRDNSMHDDEISADAARYVFVELWSPTETLVISANT